MPAIKSHSTATSDASWDAAAMKKRVRSDEDRSYYAKIYAWRDPESDQKSAYRFIHHFVSQDGTPQAASTVACSAGIAVLNGARGGTTIPAGDRRGVYNHLAAHLRDAGMEPPTLKEKPDEREEKTLNFECKSLKEDGTFVGLASTYGNVDSYGDVVEPGAFRKTIRENGKQIIITWQHDYREPIGLGTLKDTKQGLEITGKLELELPNAKTAYIRLKKGLVRGLSIGFTTVKAVEPEDSEDGYRHLKEIKLWEVALVTFPANERAQVTDVKSELDNEFAVRNALMLPFSQVEALASKLLETLLDKAANQPAKEDRVDALLDEFRANFAVAMEEFDEMRLAHKEAAADGRGFKPAAREAIERVIEDLKSLLGEAGGTSSKAATTSEGADEHKSDEPEEDALHSEQLKQFRDALVKAITENPF